MLYHLSKQRTCCIEWIEADKNVEVLEIGSDCSAITGCLADKYAHVTCVELPKRRSEINALRNKEKENIKIYVVNFQDIAPSLPKFDVITLIGVLEYGKLLYKQQRTLYRFFKTDKKPA